MEGLKLFLQLIKEQKTTEELRTAVHQNPGRTGVYPESIQHHDGSILFIARLDIGKKLFIAGDRSPLFREMDGVERPVEGFPVKECPLSVGNSRVLRKYFPFTNPTALSGFHRTIGLGDRLGLASAGHIRLIKNLDVRPILAQQSIRELNLTGRDYGQVLADAVWAVFQEGYQGGFGADGDHLKSAAEVRMALDHGFTMITLDCSEHIHNLTAADETKVETLYQALDSNQRQALEARFLGARFKVGDGLTLSYTPATLKFNAAVYQQAIDFAIGIYRELLQPLAGRVDFEVSIDETQTPTDPASHYFVALQLAEAGVKANSVAPRFCGEFQKGIDYLGDTAQFAEEFREHQAIAAHFGYKLSIHSGSDKFSVFPIIGRETGGVVHVKTAGTNWLEAIRVIIETDPGLYREIHRFALTQLGEARKYYHISADPGRIPDLDGLSDAQLAGLMEQNDARQVIHITYGLILQAKDENGNYRFRDRIYRCLNENENLYYLKLENHIGKHLGKLGFLH
jgi:hypothetical protein